MPKETKDVEKKEPKKTSVKKSTTAKKTTKAASTKKTTTAKKKTTTSKSTTVKKATTKKAASTKKTTTKKSSTAKTTKKSTAKKTTTRKKSTTKKAFINEYYDLPYRYNQTVVKILAQTPTKMFVYWDISDEDRMNFQKTYGDKFFEATKPVLIIHNITLDYYFEVDINDFANSWYLDLNDANCEYTVELGRRPLPFNQNTNIEPDKPAIPSYIYISSSNDLEVPNNKVLFNPPIYQKIYFRNVKTNQVIEKDISEFPLMSEFYRIYDLYKNFYKDEDLDFINNPSSGATSSRSYSSWSK